MRAAAKSKAANAAYKSNSGPGAQEQPSARSCSSTKLEAQSGFGTDHQGCKQQQHALAQTGAAGLPASMLPVAAELVLLAAVISLTTEGMIETYTSASRTLLSCAASLLHPPPLAVLYGCDVAR